MTRPGPAGIASGGLLAAGGLALTVMMLWTVADVVMRGVAHRGLHGSIDAVEVLLVLVVFLGLAACCRRDELIKVDLFDAMMPPVLLRAVRAAAGLATAAFLGLLAAAVWPSTMDAYRFDDVKPDLPVRIAWLLVAIELSLIVSTLITLGRTVRDLAAPGATPDAVAMAAPLAGGHRA